MRRKERPRRAAQEAEPEPASPVATMPLEPDDDGAPSEAPTARTAHPRTGPKRSPRPSGGRRRGRARGACGAGSAQEAAPAAPAPQAREETLVNLLVWVTMGIAVWHFAVFVPDRFWGGIVGAFGAAAWARCCSG